MNGVIVVFVVGFLFTLMKFLFGGSGALCHVFGNIVKSGLMQMIDGNSHVL
jgi:hypothetical protein